MESALTLVDELHRKLGAALDSPLLLATFTKMCRAMQYLPLMDADNLARCENLADNLQNLFGKLASESLRSAKTEKSTPTSGRPATSATTRKRHKTSSTAPERSDHQRASTSKVTTLVFAEPALTTEKLRRRYSLDAATERGKTVVKRRLK